MSVLTDVLAGQVVEADVYKRQGLSCPEIVCLEAKVCWDIGSDICVFSEGYCG